MSAFTVFVFRTTKDITSDPRDVDLKQPLSWPLQMRLFQGSAMDKFQRFRECLAFHDSHAVSGMVTIEQLSQDETPELSVSLSTHKPKVKGDSSLFKPRCQYELKCGLFCQPGRRHQGRRRDVHVGKHDGRPGALSRGDKVEFRTGSVRVRAFRRRRCGARQAYRATGMETRVASAR